MKIETTSHRQAAMLRLIGRIDSEQRQQLVLDLDEVTRWTSGSCAS